jgi:hypothetical protein
VDESGSGDLKISWWGLVGTLRSWTVPTLLNPYPASCVLSGNMRHVFYCEAEDEWNI